MTCDLHGKLKFHSLKEVIIGGQKHSIGGKKKILQHFYFKGGNL